MLAAWMLGAALPVLAANVYPEASVKAAFVLRFADYVEWPRPPERNFVIAVLGRGDMAASLQALATRSAHGRPVQVRRIRRAEEARDAQILYVGSDRSGSLAPLLKAVPGRGVLVVTEEEAGLDSGSTINFLVADGRVRFEISASAASRAGLKVSSELLGVAARVVE
jgi:hypothetical protein